jgi:2-haloacid dehalogenase
MLCVFDVNETLLDLAALDDVFDSPEARQEWFGLVIHTALTVTASGGYRDFAQIAGAAAARFGVDGLGPRLRSLPPHPDVAEGLAALRAGGHTLVALTNSPLATAEAQLSHAGLDFDRIFSAETVESLKPSAPPYRQVLEAYGISAGDALMVAAHDWDIAGAQAAGMRTALITRPGVHALPGSPAPTYTAADIPALATRLE